MIFFFFIWIIVFLLHGKSWPQYTFRMTIVEKYLITESLQFYSKSFSQTKVKKSLLPISYKKKSQIYCIESSYFEAFYYQEAQSFLFRNRFDFFSFRNKCDRCQVFLFIVRFTFEINWPITLFFIGFCIKRKKEKARKANLGIKWQMMLISCFQFNNGQFFYSATICFYFFFWIFFRYL